jgi:hypothetical protein
MLAEEYIIILTDMIEQYGRTQTQEILNIPQSLLSNIMTGRRSVSISVRERIENHYRKQYPEVYEIFRHLLINPEKSIKILKGIKS